MSLVDEFNSAVVKSKELTKRPSNEELLSLYGLFKQSSEGDNTEERPGFDFKAIAKHDAWVSQKGKKKDQAMGEYITLVNDLYQQYR
jgi:diazepam-binding inhibitor (GABA receptor modulating acyl-CoA-binding protein)